MYVFFFCTIIILFSETWLNDNRSASSFNNHVLYRCDRDILKTDKERGGGASIAVNNRLHPRSVRVLCLVGSVEQVFVEIVFKNIYIKFLIGCVYIPPRSEDGT